MISGRPWTWGVATSAYQIEGGRGEGGKGDSIWDQFSDMGKLSFRGDVACDHFHRWEQDLDLIADLGVDAYRFSIAWSRILPQGVGAPNPEGVAFYRQLITGMRDRGIEPWLTLYHWDLPVALNDRGGWPSRQSIDWFSEYTKVVVEELGDLVTNWITQNEPWVASFLGYRDGIFAPGLKDWNAALAAGHHLLVAHGRAASLIREAQPESSVGIAIDCRPATPASESPEDLAATSHFDGFRNRWFFDPVHGMGYPQDMVDAYVEAGHLPPGMSGLVREGDLDDIAAPIDFLGLNYYTTSSIAAGQEEDDEPYRSPGVDQPDDTTEMGWLIDPEGLRDYLLYLAARYSPKSIVVTENGASYSTGPTPEGVITDDRRIGYLDRHIDAVMEAVELGAPVDGYFVWSLLDNVEWVSGISQRFGLVWVDFETLQRLPKQSYHWYQQRIRVEGQNPAIVSYPSS